MSATTGADTPKANETEFDKRRLTHEEGVRQWEEANADGALTRAFEEIVEKHRLNPGKYAWGVQNSFTKDVRSRMRELGVSEARLAEELGKPVDYVERVLNNSEPLTAGDMGVIGSALGCYVKISMVSFPASKPPRIVDKNGI